MKSKHSIIPSYSGIIECLTFYLQAHRKSMNEAVAYVMNNLSVENILLDPNQFYGDLKEDYLVVQEGIALFQSTH